MKRILSVVIALPLSLVISYCSGFITVSTDYSTEATVGITRFKGLPFWFYEQASGISIMAGWHPQRVMWNTGFWIVLLVGLAIYFTRKKRPNHAMEPSGETPAAHG